MAEVQGFIAPGFERVADVFAAHLDAGEEIGAGFAALRDGEIVINIWGGAINRAGDPWKADTLVPVYSTTKAIAAIVLARIFDDGGFDYEAPLSKLWPDFGAHGKDKLTIAEALSHQAGVPGFIEPIDPALWLDPPALADKLAALEPMWPPASASGYHPMTWGYIAGEIARRACKRSLGTVLREDICAPLGIDFHIGLPDSEHARCADMRKPSKAAEFGEITPPRKAAFFMPWSAPTRGGADWRRAEMPAANGHGTALAVAQLYGAYASGGEINGANVLSAAAFAALTRKRIEGPDLVLPFNIDWRAGVMGNSNRVYGPNPEAFGHSGNGGSCGLGDPERGVSAGYVMNKQSNYLMGDPRALALIRALYECLDG